jgi:serine/threonine protein kinase
MEYTETGEIIGEGAFGRVVVVTDTDGRRYAKKICTYKKYIRETLTEYEIMQSLAKNPDHPGYEHVVHLLSAVEDAMGEGVELVMDLYEGCLLDLMQEKDECELIVPLDETIVLDVARHISLGLSYMNFCRLTHGDLKPENILWRRSSTSKSGYHFALADFGNTVQITSDKVYQEIQTREYRCVENILDEPVGLSCDMTSLGCILYEAITGDYLVNRTDTDDHIAEMLEIIGRQTLAKYDSSELPKLGPFLEEIQSVQGDLSTKGCVVHDLLQEVFDENNYEKQEEMIDFIIQSIIPYPKQRLQAHAALDHPLLK